MTEEKAEAAQESPADGAQASAESGLHAKTISKVFKFVAAAGIIACAVLRWCAVMPDATAAEICLIWAAVYGIGAGTIDLNIMFDKFSGARK